MRFSERYKYKEEKAIAFECITTTLRTRIWNLFYQNDILSGGLSSKRISKAIDGKPVIENLIADKLGFSVCNDIKSIQNKLQSHIINSKWFEVYDFVEIHLESIDEDERSERLNQYNRLLEEEKSAYRIVDRGVVPITDNEELECLNSTISSPYESVATHMKKALKLYAQRENPDYENSIKESISAVEAVCCILNGKNTTLGSALKNLKDKDVHIHGAMEAAFASLYGYTSDEKGIRHAGIDFSDAPAEDAKYMLISCSAFVNYLIEKQIKTFSSDSV